MDTTPAADRYTDDSLSASRPTTAISRGAPQRGAAAAPVVWGLLMAFTDSATSCFANYREYVSWGCDAFEVVDAPVLIGKA